MKKEEFDKLAVRLGYDGWGKLERAMIKDLTQKISGSTPSGSNLKFYTYKLPEDTHRPIDDIETTEYFIERVPLGPICTTWTNGLRFVIQRDGVKIELYSGEIDDLIRALKELRTSTTRGKQ